MTEVVTELERGALPARPFAVVAADGDIATAGTNGTPWPVLPATVSVYLDAATRKAAREAVEDVQEALWEALFIGIGDGRELLVPLFDYTGRPAVQRVEVLRARAGTWRIGHPAAFSAPLELGAQPIDVRAGVEAALGIAPGNLLGLGRAGGPWFVRFDGVVRGQPFALLEGDASALLSDGSVDPPAVAVAVESIGAADPWRTPRDFVRVEQAQLGSLVDPGDPTMRTVTAGLRLTWARGGRVPSAEMTMTGIDVRGTGG